MWGVDVCIHCEMITKIKLINISVSSQLLLGGEKNENLFSANKCIIQFY